MPYSVSLLETFRACPFAARQRMDRVPEAVSPIARIGSLAHAVFARYALHCARSGQMSDLNALPRIADELTAQSPAEEASEVVSLADAFGDCAMIPEGARAELAIGLDREFQLIRMKEDASHEETQSWNDAFFTGVLDLWWREDGPDGPIARIRDYKTGWNLPPDSQAGKGLQLRTYAFLLSRAWASDDLPRTIDVSTLHVRYAVERGPVPLGPGDWDKTRADLLRAIRQIEVCSEWPCTPGPRCGYCGYTGICPAMRRALDDKADPSVRDADSAQSVAGRLLLMEEWVEKAKKSLKAWVADNGPVRVGDGAYSYRKHETAEWPDAKAVVDCLRAAGVDSSRIWSALTVGKTSLTSAIGRSKKVAPVWEALNDIAVMDTAVRFEFAKEGDDAQ